MRFSRIIYLVTCHWPWTLFLLATGDAFEEKLTNEDEEALDSPNYPTFEPTKPTKSNRHLVRLVVLLVSRHVREARQEEGKEEVEEDKVADEDGGHEVWDAAWAGDKNTIPH